MAPRALLLDFDGVIADTENVHVAAWQRTFSAMGWEIADEVCVRSIEMEDREFLDEVFDARKILDGDVDGWVLRKQELTISLLADCPRLYPGVSELIERVKARGSVKLGVVSSTWRANVTTVLKAAGLYSSFSLIVGKEDVQAFKPDPAPYALAVKSLGLRAEDVVAIEDSVSGLASARDAGVRALAVGHRLAEGTWIGRSRYVAHLRDTDTVLAAIGL